MGATMLTPAGGNQPHENMQPYLAVTFIIAMTGTFPPRS
jgi:microcystin-dependent protein